MAKKELVEKIVNLYSKLGGNMNNVLGSRSNITFLGTGKNPEPFTEMAINIEAVGALGKSKVLKELESPMGYLTADKLNDIQAGKLYENLLKLDEFYNPRSAPANITDMATRTGDLDPRGLAALRSRFRNRENVDLDDIPPGSRGGPDDIAAPFESAEETLVASKGSKLMKGLEEKLNALRTQKSLTALASTNRGDVPMKRATAREFLVEALKESDDLASGRTTLSDFITATDKKFIMEGGGGVAGDPIVLVEKYFGPRIAEAVPARGLQNDEIIEFTKRVLNNVVDAAGNKPDSPRFDRFTARFVDEMAEGGRAGYRLGKSVFKGIANLFKKGADDADLIKQEETFRSGPITMDFLETVDPKVTDKFIRTRDMKGSGSFGLYSNISEMPQGLQAAEFLKKIRIPGKNQIDYEKAEMFIGGGVKLSGKESLNELIEMFLNAMKSYKSPFAKGGLAKILEV